MPNRVAHTSLKSKVMITQEAAQSANHGDMMGFAGFTDAGYPKVVSSTLIGRIEVTCGRDDEFRIKVLTDALTTPEFDGVLAKANGMERRISYQSDPIIRNRINAGDAYHSDMYLSRSDPMTEQGSFGPTNAAVVEAVRIRADDSLILSSSVGGNISYPNTVGRIIIEVDS